MQYKITRTKRRTLAIYVRRDATVEVRAPLRAKDADIERFVRSKQDWIISTIDKQRANIAQRAEMEPHCGKTKSHGCEKILRLSADIVIRKKVNYYASIMNVRPNSVRITSARSRWGSCGPQNNICFSWRLILMNDNLIDYVVVHELSHIQWHDHSPRFWAVVAKYMPDYKLRRKALRAAAKELMA